MKNISSRHITHSSKLKYNNTNRVGACSRSTSQRPRVTINTHSFRIL